MRKRVDENQKQIVSTFRKLGADVLILSHVGQGCPDLLINVNSYNILIEIKDGSKPPSRQRLTPCEKKFFEKWGGEVYVINSMSQAVELVNSARKRNVIKFML